MKEFVIIFCRIFLVRSDIFENVLKSVYWCKLDFPLARVSLNKVLKLWVEKSSSFSVHLTIRRNSENIEQENMVEGILLSQFGMWTMKNWNLSLLSNSLQTNIPYSILMPRSKNIAFVPLCSTFSSNFPGYITNSKDFENLLSLFIAQRSSMNRLVAWYYALFDFLEVRF